jgi:hypothetical protein
MRSARGTRKHLARSWAMIMAAVGALLVSSGVALMVSPTTANAGDNKGHNDNDKIVVCKYVGKPGQSALQRGGANGGNPEEVSVSTLKNLDPPWDGSTFPFAWTDAQGQAVQGSIAIGYVGEVASTLSACPGYQPEVQQAVPKAEPVPPTCAANVPSYTTAGSVGVASWDEGAAPAFGKTITLTAHAAPGYAFGDAATTTVDVIFGPAATGCTTDETPTTPPTTTQVSPPKAQTTTKSKAETTSPAETTVPTVVEAGLSGATAPPSETGLALLIAGLVLLSGAAGVVTRGRRTTV